MTGKVVESFPHVEKNKTRSATGDMTAGGNKENETPLKNKGHTQKLMTMLATQKLMTMLAIVISLMWQSVC